ncbi:MAG: hypothetical protein M1819_003494 [Sarea resinae]|nr:MAG: hypothetical protein M1819_003494 [Sarea resinae]
MRLLATVIVISLLAFFLVLASIILFQQWWINRQRRKQKEGSLAVEESTPVTKLTVRRGRVVPASKRNNSVGSAKPNWLRRLSKISAYSGPPRSEKSAYPLPDSPLTPRFGIFHASNRAESIQTSTASRAHSIKTNASYDEPPAGGPRGLQVSDANRSRLSQVKEDLPNPAPVKGQKIPLVQIHRQTMPEESPTQGPHSLHRLSAGLRIPHQGIFSVECVSHLATHNPQRNSTASVPAGRRDSAALLSARAKSAEPIHDQGHESRQSCGYGKSDDQRLITASPAVASSSSIIENDPFDLSVPSPVFLPQDKHMSAHIEHPSSTRPKPDVRNGSGRSAYELMGPFGASAADYRPSPTKPSMNRPLHISEMTFLQSASSESEGLSSSNYNNDKDKDNAPVLSKMRVPLSAFNTVFSQQPSHNHQHQQPMELSSGVRRARSVISAKSFASLTSADGSSSVLTVAQELPMPIRDQVQARRKEKNLPPLPALENIISQPKIMPSSFSRPAKAQDLQRMRAAVKSEAWVV